MKYSLTLSLAFSLVLTGCGAGGGEAKNQTPQNDQPGLQFIDTDADGIFDGQDNCRLIENPLQQDIDRDGIGDSCDLLIDSDRDGIADTVDNCPTDANLSQADSDSDGRGDVCDPVRDDDGDGVDNTIDNCIAVFNPDQRDNDDDSQGNDCDLTPNGPDTDGDGYGDIVDNCISVRNVDQSDIDENSVGDLCDNGDNGDLDGDGVVNVRDADFTGGPDVNQNGVDDNSEPANVDTDLDGIVDSDDNCRFAPNYDQSDANSDGVGDACRIEALGVCGNESGDDSGAKFTTTLPWTDNCAIQEQGEWADTGYVLGIQTILSCIGYNLSIDGNYGPATRARIESFQSNKGLEINGMVDAATWAELRKQLLLNTDTGRYIRYSIGSCNVQGTNSYAFDWDVNEQKWEVLTDDVIDVLGTGSKWFKFSTEPVSYIQ